MKEATVILKSLFETDAPQITLLAINRNIWVHVRDLMPFPYSLQDAQSFIQNVINQHKDLLLGIIHDEHIYSLVNDSP